MLQLKRIKGSSQALRLIIIDLALKKGKPGGHRNEAGNAVISADSLILANDFCSFKVYQIAPIAYDPPPLFLLHPPARSHLRFGIPWLFSHKARA
ncbi:MAG: hypothetical protein H6508_07190 [Calditrichaeota bacterium]|nr:hypothetical protein [Calditrichota bacterium]